jgi:hypothetical protein
LFDARRKIRLAHAVSIAASEQTAFRRMSSNSADPVGVTVGKIAGKT